ncbi:MAG: hypothetical protein V4731_01820 [Pseudomonadota bacterium]
MKKIGMAVLATVLALQVGAQELFVRQGFSGYAPIKMTSLEVVGREATVGGYPMLQTGLDLKFLTANVFSSTGVVLPMGQIIVGAHREKKLLFMMNMRTNLEQNRAQSWNDDPCKRTDLLWKRATGGIQDVNCATINHGANFLRNPSGNFAKADFELKEAAIETPATVIQVAFDRLGRNMQYLSYIVQINPEQFGFERDSSAWATNSWHKDRIAKDPKKLEFIARLVKWAEDVQSRMEPAFQKDPNAFSSLASLDSYLTEKSSVAAAKP